MSKSVYKSKFWQRDKQLLEKQHSTMVRWKEPRPALDAEGNEVTANVTLEATVHDCINMARMMCKKHNKTCEDEFELLQEFLVIHYAWIDDGGVL